MLWTRDKLDAGVLIVFVRDACIVRGTEEVSGHWLHSGQNCCFCIAGHSFLYWAQRKLRTQDTLEIEVVPLYGRDTRSRMHRGPEEGVGTE